MSAYSEYFLNSASSVVQLETLVISHPSFTKDYNLVRNKTTGLVATTETGAVITFEYYPLKIVGTGIRENLDFGIRVDLGDLGDILPTELDNVSSDQAFHIKPMVVYRSYRSDDLTTPLYGPLVLEVGLFNFKRTGSVFEAKAPSLNINKTGEIYTLDRFPMLRGFL